MDVPKNGDGSTANRRLTIWVKNGKGEQSVATPVNHGYRWKIEDGGSYC